MSSPSVDELLRQFHENQTLWVARLATSVTQPTMPHSQVIEFGDTLAMRPGAAGVIMLPLNLELRATLDQHDRALNWLRDTGARDVLVWAMGPDPSIDLALLSQGYSPGFEPWWMTRDLTKDIPKPAHSVQPANALDIRELTRSDIPYVIRDQVAANQALANASGTPQVIWLVAHDGNDPIGHAIVNIVGDHAGLFNVGVGPRYRYRGVGTSLTLAAMQAAKDRGCTTMNLNSTPAGKKLYTRTGFQQFGIGQTWVRQGAMVRQLPTLAEARLVKAIGAGDITSVTNESLSQTRRLACGLTYQELASRFNQQDMLHHLIRLGQVPDIISLWKADLREEAIAAAADPIARELITGSQRAHPIHHAVEMGAGTLVIALIEAGANLRARDGEFNATPLDWAHASNKPTIARIIVRAGGT